MANDRYHGFGDIMDSEQSRGIFAGDVEDAHGGFHKTLTKPQPGGLSIEFHCDYCMRRRSMDIHYAELICAIYNRQPERTLPRCGIPIPNYQPSDWEFDPDVPGWVPKVKDPCGKEIRIQLTVPEMENALAHARRAGWVKPQAEQMLIQAISQVPPG